MLFFFPCNNNMTTSTGLAAPRTKVSTLPKRSTAVGTKFGTTAHHGWCHWFRDGRPQHVRDGRNVVSGRHRRQFLYFFGQRPHHFFSLAGVKLRSPQRPVPYANKTKPSKHSDRRGVVLRASGKTWHVFRNVNVPGPGESQRDAVFQLSWVDMLTTHPKGHPPLQTHVAVIDGKHRDLLGRQHHDVRHPARVRLPHSRCAATRTGDTRFAFVVVVELGRNGDHLQCSLHGSRRHAFPCKVQHLCIGGVR